MIKKLKSQTIKKKKKKKKKCLQNLYSVLEIFNCITLGQKK